MVVLLRIVIPVARPGIIAVAVLTWNDFAGALVLIQKPDAFTVQLAPEPLLDVLRHRPSTPLWRYGNRDGPAAVLFVVLQRSFIQDLTAGVVRR